MKRSNWKLWIVTVAAVAAMTVVPAYAQMQKWAEFDVPFAFTAMDKPMPAGHYKLTTLAQPGAFALSNFKEKASLITLWNSQSATASGVLVKLTFLKAGDAYYLKSGHFPGYEADWSRKIKAIELQAGNVPVEEVVILARR